MKLWHTFKTEHGEILVAAEQERPLSSDVVVINPQWALKDIEKHLRAGAFVLFQGPYKTARQFHSSLKKRFFKKKHPSPQGSAPPKVLYEALRKYKDQESQYLSFFLIDLAPSFITLPQWHPQIDLPLYLKLSSLEGYQHCRALPFKFLQATISSYERHQQGLIIPGLDFPLRPYYSVYYPIRQEPIVLLNKYLRGKSREYLSTKKALDIGCGTGVLSFLAASYGLETIGVDSNPTAIISATENTPRTLSSLLSFTVCPFFPAGTYDLILCNPPWIPGPVHSLLDSAIFYEPGFFETFLNKLPSYLSEDGECLLLMSNLAELLGLRNSFFLEKLCSKEGLVLKVLDKQSPQHPRSKDSTDPLFNYRSQEEVFLIQLKLQQP